MFAAWQSELKEWQFATDHHEVQGNTINCQGTVRNFQLSLWTQDTYAFHEIPTRYIYAYLTRCKCFHSFLIQVPCNTSNRIIEIHTSLHATKLNFIIRDRITLDGDRIAASMAIPSRIYHDSYVKMREGPLFAFTRHYIWDKHAGWDTTTYSRDRYIWTETIKATSDRQTWADPS